ncbi:MAG: STAS domain-containing protein [Methanoregula sp.]|jgi:anti-anti-sigma factor|nr:STAS domain-containing protein [Methanoregula sp.]MDD5187055.1 STAS domain-containing protein [Methanoregula sp.]
MEIAIENSDQISIIRARGKIDAITVAVFEDAVRSVINTTEKQNILIDLSGLVYINSGGLRVILAAAKIQKNSTRLLALSGLNTEVMKIFSLSGLNTILPIYSGEPEARVHLR